MFGGRTSGRPPPCARNGRLRGSGSCIRNQGSRVLNSHDSNGIRVKKRGWGERTFISSQEVRDKKIVSAEKYESYRAQTSNEAGEHRQEPQHIICTELDK